MKPAPLLRRVAFTWASLVALLLASLGSAYVPLGRWNAVIGLAIAALKSGLVLVVFMHLGRSGPLLKMVAAAGVFTLALLFGLSSLEEGTRAVEPADVQAPQQLPALNGRATPGAPPAGDTARSP